ncbi:hypothetical protein [Arthrobacter sp. Alg241-R88]|uniref:hypothetical protein n=1 Tax=Arthrobacter sp. Alg241-R88 TaxID=2305984 RepID=UPI0013D6B723|nr:hypothetical protein [Arthrobacter sp. Alg241-R88]
MTDWQIPRETTEWIGPVDVTPADETLELAILPTTRRPKEEDWQTPLVLDGKPGLLLTTPAAGDYAYWARVTSSPEVVVVQAFASIRVS